MVKMDYLRDEKWSNFNEDYKHIKKSSTPLFAGGYIATLRRVYNLPPKNERLNRRATGVQPTPLMQNTLSHPPLASKPYIGDRLRRIANDNGSAQGYPKQDLIAQLKGVLECVQTW